jgi:hypothetical protein
MKYTKELLSLILLGSLMTGCDSTSNGMTEGTESGDTIVSEATPKAEPKPVGWYMRTTVRIFIYFTGMFNYFIIWNFPCFFWYVHEFP